MTLSLFEFAPNFLILHLICALQSQVHGAVTEAQSPRHPIQEPIVTPRSAAADSTELLASVYKRACLEESQLSSKKYRSHKPSQLRHHDSREKREDLEEEGTDENLENGVRGARGNEAASPSCVKAASSILRSSESDSQSPIPVLASIESSMYKFKSFSKQKYLSPNTASVASALSLLSGIPYHPQHWDGSPSRHL